MRHPRQWEMFALRAGRLTWTPWNRLHCWQSPRQDQRSKETRALIRLPRGGSHKAPQWGEQE
eukprot:1956575-Prorocentrum_lima.AAC.1